jgi:hypothetical protein
MRGGSRSIRKKKDPLDNETEDETTEVEPTGDFF